MKKLLLFAFAGLLINSCFAQTAVNFTATDCAGANHDLFSELNAGKVIVITWVMPCGACITIASTAAATVDNYSTTYPGMVDFFLVDDYGDTPCSSMNTWATTNSIIHPYVFSNSAISMSDYGTPSMQKTVVLGGPNHTVFYNVNGAVVASNIQTAINNALATSIAENNSGNFQLSLFPNPVNSNSTSLNYTLPKSGNISLEIYNAIGEKVKSMNFENQAAGKHEEKINMELFRSGNYFVKLISGSSSQLLKFTVTH